MYSILPFRHSKNVAEKMINLPAGYGGGPSSCKKTQFWNGESCATRMFHIIYYRIC